MKSILHAAIIAILLGACSPTTAPEDSLSSQTAATAPDVPPAPASPRSQSADPTAANARIAEASAVGSDQARAADEGDQAVNDAIDSNLGDHVAYRAVIRELQRSVAARDAAAVAALVDYPISVEVNGKSMTIKDPATFITKYADFMTPEISKAIVDTQYKDLFVNYQGVMFGNGQAWLDGICKDDQCQKFDVKLVTLQPGPE